MKNNRPRALAVLIAVFLIGIMIGVAGSYLWLKPSSEVSRSFEGKRPPPPRDPWPDLPEFNLTSEQEEKLKPIWKETREKLEALEREMHKKLVEGEKKRQEIMAENDRRVRAILNEEQKGKFDPWIEQVRKWRERSSRHMRQEPPKENRRKPDRY